jgi:hypothetical protein
VERTISSEATALAIAKREVSLGKSENLEAAEALLEEVVTAVGWDARDVQRVTELREWLDPEMPRVAEILLAWCIQYLGGEEGAGNQRFLKRVRSAVEGWLEGMVSGPLRPGGARRRLDVLQELAELGLSVEGTVCLSAVAKAELLRLGRLRLGTDNARVWGLVGTLDKLVSLDLAVACDGYRLMHESSLQERLLGRFLAITGFSPSLYRSLESARQTR